jgi:hypothetical protein
MADSSRSDRRSPRSARGRGKPKSNGLLIGLIAGAVLLLAICGTGVIGGAIWYNRAKDGPKDIFPAVGKKITQESIVGTWWGGDVQRWEFRSDGKLKRDDFFPLGPSHFDLVYTFRAPKTVEFKGDTTGKNRWIDGSPYTQAWEIVRLEGSEMEIRELTPAPDGNTRILQRR